MLYDVKTTRKLEKKIISQNNPELSLMFKAGTAIFNHINELNKKDILILIGPGNNGGDGYALAIQAFLNNYNINCIELIESKGVSKKLKLLAKNLGIKIKKKLPDKKLVSKRSIIIDSILGIGLSREPKGSILEAIKWTNSLKNKAFIISIDIPSGLNASNGKTFNNVVNAHQTIMCLTQKQGCFTGKGPMHCGDIFFQDLGFKNTEKISKGTSYLINGSEYKQLKRNRISHKGTFGNLLIVGGYDGMEGAANLSGLAALRTGVGKVYILNNSKKKNNEIIFIKNSLIELKKILPKISAIVIGPGLGKNADEVLKYLWKTNKPIVLDADGLNWLSKNFSKKRTSETIYTPHHGEARTLLNSEFSDRFKAIKKLKKKYGGTWILKGAGTIILRKELFINNFSNSILSTAGTGDVLSGIVGGMLCQKIKKPEIKAVQIHTICAKRILNNNNKTLIASDLIKEISKCI